MKQNVNLYRPAATSAVTLPAARHVVAGLGVLVAGVVAVQLWLDDRSARLRQAADELRSQVDVAQQDLNAMTAAQMAGADASLEAELKSLLQELDLRENILGLVSGGGAGDVNGFSAQIRSLARQHADGVWLTRVQVQAPAARTTLEGRAINPDFVPVYLRRLSGEPALAGQRFDRFEIERAQEHGEPVRFALNRLATETPERQP